MVCAGYATNRAGHHRRRSVAPTISRQPSIAFVALDGQRNQGPAGDEADQVGEEQLVLVFAVVRAGFVAVDVRRFHRGYDVGRSTGCAQRSRRQPARDGVGLAEDQGGCSILVDPFALRPAPERLPLQGQNLTATMDELGAPVRARRRGSHRRRLHWHPVQGEHGQHQDEDAASSLGDAAFAGATLRLFQYQTAGTASSGRTWVPTRPGPRCYFTTILPREMPTTDLMVTTSGARSRCAARLRASRSKPTYIGPTIC